jgi:hypothetical protein
MWFESIACACVSKRRIDLQMHRATPLWNTHGIMHAPNMNLQPRAKRTRGHPEHTHTHTHTRTHTHMTNVGGKRTSGEHTQRDQSNVDTHKHNFSQTRVTNESSKKVCQAIHVCVPTMFSIHKIERLANVRTMRGRDMGAHPQPPTACHRNGTSFPTR